MKNKFRNLLLAAALIVAFVAAGIVLYSVWIVQRPFAVILFLVPELDTRLLAAARQYLGGSGARLEVESWPGSFLLRSGSAGNPVGEPTTLSRLLAAPVPSSKAESLPLLQYAARQGRLTGLVTNGRLTSPSLAAFYAPDSDLENSEQTSLLLLETRRPEVILGGGAANLLPDFKGGIRKDGRDLFLEARQGGYDIVRNLAELRNTPTWRSPRVLGVFAAGELPAATAPENSDQPTLANLVASAIQFLQFQRRGYFLLVDCARLGSAAESNNGEELLREFLAVNEALRTARQYAGKNSLLLVVGTGVRGGFSLNANTSAHDSGLAILSTSAAGVPAVVWATGPGKPNEQTGISEPVAFPATKPVPVVSDTLCFLLSSEISAEPHGIRDAAFVAQLLRDAL